MFLELGKKERSRLTRFPIIYSLSEKGCWTVASRAFLSNFFKEQWAQFEPFTIERRSRYVNASCHVSKICGWQQTKTSLKKWIRTVSNFIDLNQFHLICQMLAKFSGLNPKGPYVSLEKEKENFCVVLTYSKKRAREIGKFHVAVVQQRLRNVQTSVMHVRRFFFFLPI